MNARHAAKFFGFLLAALTMLSACADIDPETRGTAHVRMRVDGNNSGERSAVKTGITLDEAKTALVVLRPAAQCSTNYGPSSSDYDRALLDLSAYEVEMVVPLEVQLKLCLYFFSAVYSLADLASADIEAESFGESEIFSVDYDTSVKTVVVDFWGTFFSTVTVKIGSVSSAGLVTGTTGSLAVSDLSGNKVYSDNITISDNTTHTVPLNLEYGSYSYQVTLNGFSSTTDTFLLASSEEILDIKLTPNMLDLDWISFDNMSVSQFGTSPYANASGSLVVEVPLAKKDNVTQIISTMVVKNTANSSTLDITPDTALPSAYSTNSDNVTYRIDFTTPTTISLVNGSNSFVVIISIEGSSKQVSMGSVTYDACIDNSAMCFTLTWTDGSDPDLHSYYFPGWAYSEEDNASFDNESRGTRYHVYSNASYQKYVETGDTIQLADGTELTEIDTSAVNRAEFSVDAATDDLTFVSGTDLSSVTTGTPVSVSSSGTLPSGLSTGTLYYAHSIDSASRTLKLADNSSGAILGTALDLGDSGSGTHTLTVHGTEVQVWATNSGAVADGTYLVWVEDVTNADLQGVRVDLSAPGLDGDLSYGPFRFKDDLDNTTTEAPNQASPYRQPVFFIQVDNGSIARTDNISVGDNLSSWNDNLSHWIGDLEATLIE